jgi:hypothetical protein
MFLFVFRLLEVGSLLDIIKHKMKSTDCKVSSVYFFAFFLFSSLFTVN